MSGTGMAKGGGDADAKAPDMPFTETEVIMKRVLPTSLAVDESARVLMAELVGKFAASVSSIAAGMADKDLKDGHVADALNAMGFTNYGHALYAHKAAMKRSSLASAASTAAAATASAAAAAAESAASAIAAAAMVQMGTGGSGGAGGWTYSAEAQARAREQMQAKAQTVVQAKAQTVVQAKAQTVVQAKAQTVVQGGSQSGLQSGVQSGVGGVQAVVQAVVQSERGPGVQGGHTLPKRKRVDTWHPNPDMWTVGSVGPAAPPKSGVPWVTAKLGGERTEVSVLPMGLRQVAGRIALLEDIDLAIQQGRPKFDICKQYNVINNVVLKRAELLRARGVKIPPAASKLKAQVPQKALFPARGVQGVGVQGVGVQGQGVQGQGVQAVQAAYTVQGVHGVQGAQGVGVQGAPTVSTILSSGMGVGSSSSGIVGNGGGSSGEGEMEEGGGGGSLPVSAAPLRPGDVQPTG